ncbi:hypothetical protein O2K51_10015 [Apibacter raozihei]|uniref:hypothetical protein n=1 Tax=Apibacter raozihei TaxID=2500547 RepID=UPI000FE2A79C|nr:hypothetical protein [Apibacter raozihei]
MNWEELSKNIYHKDGSLRDIFIDTVTRKVWSKWIDHINANFSVKFYNGESNKYETSINKIAIFDYWSEKTHSSSNAEIMIQNLKIECYFFDEIVFENSFDPSEIKSIEDHYTLQNYLVNISILLNKKVILAEENSLSLNIKPLITVDKHNILF